MKYGEETTKKICKMLSEGYGRVATIKAVKINYQTFINWMNDERKVEFLEAIKKAEGDGKDFIKDVCKTRIIDDPSWQSAAWWLERNYPEEFGRRQAIEHSGKIERDEIKVIVADEKTAEEIKKMINK